MNSWKLRFLIIGSINLIISIIVFFTREFQWIIIGYMIVSLLVTLIGILWTPTENAESIE